MTPVVMLYEAVPVVLVFVFMSWGTRHETMLRSMGSALRRGWLHDTHWLVMTTLWGLAAIMLRSSGHQVLMPGVILAGVGW